MNTCGNIPASWYDDYPHIGYTLSGEKILRAPRKDQLDEFLAKMDDPLFWTSVQDPHEPNPRVLTDTELKIVHRISSSLYGNPDFEEFESDWFTRQTELNSLHPNHPEKKFPSATELAKIKKALLQLRESVPKGTILSDLWTDNAAPRVQSVPRMPLPGHHESYNPPMEYVVTDRKQQSASTEPRRYTSMRLVPSFDLVRERYSRCLDLYLCPRTRKPAEVDPLSLLPQFCAADYEPFPKRLAYEFKGHTSAITSLCVFSSGQFIVSSSLDKSVRLWEVSTSRCLYVWPFDEPVNCVAVHPTLSLLAVACGDAVYLINYGITVAATDEQSKMASCSTLARNLEEKIVWRKPQQKLIKHGTLFVIRHPLGSEITQVSWHSNGDYFTSVSKAGASAVLVHQLSKQSSLQPFSKAKGALTVAARLYTVKSHALLYLATQRHVFVYDMTTKQRIKKFVPGVQWISCMDIKSPEHVIVGSHDKRLCWWDSDIGEFPYKKLDYNEPVRDAKFHKQLPLLATCGETSIYCLHAKTFTDLNKNPLIVPLKQIKAQCQVSCLEWHPFSPYLITGCGNGTIKFWA